MLYIVGDVDLVGEDTESHVAVRLRALEARISASPWAAGAVLACRRPRIVTLALNGSDRHAAPPRGQVFGEG